MRSNIKATAKTGSSKGLLVAWLALSALAFAALAWAGRALAWYFSHPDDPQRHEAIGGAALIVAFGMPVFLGVFLISRKLAVTGGNGYYLPALVVGVIAIGEMVLTAMPR